MTEEMPDLLIEVLTITLDRQSGRVSVDYQGMNYLEAIGLLTVALNQIQEVPFEIEMEYDEDDDN
jgi:hypothetical protein